MGEGALDVLAAAPHEPLAARAAHASAIVVDGALRLRHLRPVASAALRLGDVGPDRDGGEVDHRLVAVIPLIGDDLGQRRRVALAACAASTCSAAAMAVSTRLVVSPTSAPCNVTATSAPPPRSTVCSAVGARCVRPSFIFVIFASGSDGFAQSLFDVRFFRRRSRRANASARANTDSRVDGSSHASAVVCSAVRGL